MKATFIIFVSLLTINVCGIAHAGLVESRTQSGVRTSAPAKSGVVTRSGGSTSTNIKMNEKDKDEYEMRQVPGTNIQLNIEKDRKLFQADPNDTMKNPQDTPVEYWESTEEYLSPKVNESETEISDLQKRIESLEQRIQSLEKGAQGPAKSEVKPPMASASPSTREDYAIPPMPFEVDSREL